MPAIAIIAGSPAPASRALGVARHIADRLAIGGFTTELINVRDLPAEALLLGQVDTPAIRAAAGTIARAQGVVLVTPVYKAAYTGLLKSLLDVLPQSALAGKVVLPIAIGGSLAHLLAIDYALRPVLISMGAPHVIGGLFILDQWLSWHDTRLAIDQVPSERLTVLMEELAHGVRTRLPLSPPDRRPDDAWPTVKA
jgi:FMN reductase